MQVSVVTPLRIAVLDDHSLIRLALNSRLSRETDLAVVGVYSGSAELISALRVLTIDLLVLDYQLQDGELDGLNLIRLLRKQYPHLLILISSSAEKPAIVKLAIGAGANGFLGKSQPVDDLTLAIRTVASGQLYLSSMMALEFDKKPISGQERPSETDESPAGDTLLAGNLALSPKEREVLRCCLEGMQVSQIALKFMRSPKTISGQKQSAFRKLGIRTDHELFRLQHNLDQQ